MRLCDYVMFGRVSMVSILSTVSTVAYDFVTNPAGSSKIL